jgi:hypothetical protein
MWRVAALSNMEIRKIIFWLKVGHLQVVFLSSVLFLSMGCMHSNQPPVARKEPV